ncbi:MAG: tetracycline resistance MFS efflux pump [Candidatus Rokuibacteriota bacterium]|nr:MAG: tetracycline resistance MFS efflux pump [Candidatus Rokubacteria bacterium]PYN23421.1 MAG: tetracycline resistance MFS efflux pump [Candidatus Rokubacteria bacterium]
MTARRQAALAFIFVTVLLDMLALGLIAPVLAPLVVSFYGGDTARAAEIYGVAFTLFAAMQFVASPVLGALSDRFGRRPIVLLSNLGLGLDYVLMALAPNVGWLLVGRVLSGVTSASITAAGAYVADVTPEERRAAGFGMIGAAFGLGFVLGPALGGLLGSLGPRVPFWVAAALSLVNAAYGFFVLPESLPPERRAGFAWRRANPVGALVILRGRPVLRGLASMMFLRHVAHAALPSTFVLYATYRYGWNQRAVGLALAGVGVGSLIVQGAVVAPFVRRFGDVATLLWGLGFGAVGFAVYGLAATGAVFCVGIVLLSLWGLSWAASQGLMTRNVGPSEQGRLQGMDGGLRGIADLVGPGLFTLTFAHFIRAQGNGDLPGAPFLLAAGLQVAALAIAWWVTRPRPAAASAAT